MNPITLLAHKVRERVPGSKVSEDLAEHPTGSSFLDLEYEGRTAIVEWKPGKGFGISSGPVEGLGTGPDEVYSTIEQALERVEDVLLRGQRTVPLKELSLKRIREMRRITQQELAKALSVQQAGISKLESRGDMRLSTLYKFIEALGGKLELVARFPEFEVSINPFVEPGQDESPETA